MTFKHLGLHFILPVCGRRYLGFAGSISVSRKLRIPYILIRSSYIALRLFPSVQTPQYYELHIPGWDSLGHGSSAMPFL